MTPEWWTRKPGIFARFMKIISVDIYANSKLIKIVLKK